MVQRVETAKLAQEHRRLCAGVEELLGRYRAAHPASSSSSIKTAPILSIGKEKKGPVLVGRVRFSGGGGEKGEEAVRAIPVRVGEHHLQFLASKFVPTLMQ